jgi:hypothetical protein
LRDKIESGLEFFIELEVVWIDGRRERDCGRYEILKVSSSNLRYFWQESRHTKVMGGQENL